MKMRIDKIFYSRNLKAGFILSLTILTALFYSFPKIEKSLQKIQQADFAITISDVPSTRQEGSGGQPLPARPVFPKIFLPDNFEVILPDVEIASSDRERGTGLLAGSSEGSSSGITGKGDSQISGGAFIPRQILEVFPAETKSRHTGEIKLSLKIGADGSVLSHKILQNTTGSEECLENSIKAAYKSKWSPIKGDLLAAEYWVEKRYEFK